LKNSEYVYKHISYFQSILNIRALFYL